MNSIRAHGAIPFYSWGSQSIPSDQPNEPNFQLSDVIDGHLRRLHPQVRRSREGLGPPLLPPLQLGDERRLVPLVRGRQRQQARRVRRRLAPRARHLHRRSARPTRPGSGAPTSTRTTRCRASPPSTPATNTSTGPGSTATTGAPTRPSPTAGAASTSSTARPTTKITDTIAPSKPLMISEVGSTEYGGSKAAWIKDMLAKIPDRLPEDPRPALVREVRRRHGLADRDLRQRHQRLRRGHPEPGLREQQLRLPGRLRPGPGRKLSRPPQAGQALCQAAARTNVQRSCSA